MAVSLPPSTTTCYLVVPVEPMSYQRYGEKKDSRGKRFRWKPPELKTYQDTVYTYAARAGFSRFNFSKSIRVRAFFFVKPMGTEKGEYGLSSNQKDVDNMIKAAMDALDPFFNDRYIADERGVKIYMKDERLRGLLLKIDNASMHSVKQLMEDCFRDSEEAQPWLRKIVPSTTKSE